MNNITYLKECVFKLFAIARILSIVAISIMLLCSLFIKESKRKAFKSVVAITTGYLLMYIAVKLMM